MLVAAWASFARNIAFATPKATIEAVSSAVAGLITPKRTAQDAHHHTGFPHPPCGTLDNNRWTTHFRP